MIGSAGTKEKCDWLKELGFDHVFNYKETSVDDALKQFAPNGVDLHFDNVRNTHRYVNGYSLILHSQFARYKRKKHR